MDPNKCFADLKQYLKDSQFDDAYETASDLVEWIERGGFKPVGVESIDISLWIPTSSPLFHLLCVINRAIAR